MALKIDRQVVAPWEVEPLETFKETWEHVLSCALVWSVRVGRRGFKDTKPLFKQGHVQVKRLEGESLTFEKVTEIVAGWLGARSQENKEDLVSAWARDPSTEGIVAAYRFGDAYVRSIHARPQTSFSFV